MSENRGIWGRIKKAMGEISQLRYSPTVIYPIGNYSLDSYRVDYKLARELYRNINDKYKLGAGFVKPIINTTVGFMGVPHFSHNDIEAHMVLEEWSDRWSGKMIRINRNTLRDGDCFVKLERIQDKYVENKYRLEMKIIPPEFVIPIPDVINGGFLEVIIYHPVPLYDSHGRIIGEAKLVERINKNEIEWSVEGNVPRELLSYMGKDINRWGIVPIVHFKNEAEENNLWGLSEIEAVEPFLKAYHDTFLFAIQGAKLFARPKVKFSLRSVDKFLRDNFSEEELREGRIRFDNKEIFFLSEGDDVSFITTDSGLEAITTLLKFIFFCIVDVSETPEFAFGTAVQSSKASVSEQMIPLARKIRRKRNIFEEYYKELSEMYLYMWSLSEGRKLDSYEVDIGWDEVNPRNDKEIAEAINNLMNGLSKGVETGLISLQSASEFLRDYIPSMLPYLDESGDDDERRRIAKGFVLRQRLEDGQGLEFEE